MFEFIRTHQKLMQFFLLVFLSPLFVVGGMQVSRFSESDTAVAKVGNKVISQEEVDYALREQDPRTYDTPGVKQQVLDRLIAERTLSMQALHDRSYPVAADIQGFILKNFPELGDPSLSKEERAQRYNAIAASQGMTIDALESRVGSVLVFDRTAGEIQSSAFAPKSLAAHLADVIEQEREVQQIAFKSADFVSQAKVTDDMLKSYYNKNLAQFQVPEQAKIEYVVLSVNDLAQQMQVADTEASAYYEQNKKRYVVEEQRRASHILIKVAKNASDAERAQAKAKAEKLLVEVRKTPGEFARVAKENSADEGSAAHGGDLDFFGKGMMVKPFQDAVYKLNPGEISDVVQTDFGYHIIMLTAIKPAEVKSFGDVKADIVTELKKQKAGKKFSELRETFTNTVYEQADSLKPVVEKLGDAGKLKIETATGVTRKPDPALAPTIPYNSQKFLTALFADDSLKNKHNTEAIEISPGVLISGRVSEYKAASQKSFEEVQAVVREAVTQAEARSLAQKAGEAKLAALKAKDDSTGFSAPITVSRTAQANVNPIVLQILLKADISKLPALVGVDAPGQDYAVYRINKVSQPVKPDPARRTTIQQQLDGVLGQQEMGAYVDTLKQNAKVKILRPDYLNPTGKNPGEGDTK